MKIIITEEQLNKIYSEQTIIGTLAARPPVGRFNLSKAPKSSGGGRLGFPEDSPIDDIPCEYDNQEKVEQLFIQAKTWTSTSNDWNTVKPIGEKMKSAMEGIGSGDIVNLFKDINTKPKLSALIKNWKYDNEDLYTWMNDEYLLKWGDLVKVLTVNFHLFIPHCRPGCECPVS
jgi:hypothetical protein